MWQVLLVPMLTLTVFLTTLSFLLWYTTSTKTPPLHPVLSKRKWPRGFVRLVAFGVLALSICTSVSGYGAVAGVLVAVIVLMAVGGSMVLLVPLRVVRWPQLAVLFLGVFLIEILFA